MIKPLRDAQVRDVVFALKHKKTGNLSDPGTGKTPPANVFMYYLWKELGIRTVFIMPKKLFQQNKLRFQEFTEFVDDDVVLVRGTPAQREKIMQSDAKVFIATFDFFKPGVSKKNPRPSDYNLLKEYHPDVKACVIDEIHMGYGGINSARTTHWLSAMRHMEYVLAMTGTLIDGSLSTAYPFIHMVEPRYYFSYNDFLNQHALLDDWGKPVVWRNREKVRAILERHSIRHTFEEVHGEEKVVFIHETTEMSPAHKKYYQKFLKTNMIELEREFKEMSSGGETILRARQILQCPEVFEPDQAFDLGKDELALLHMVNAQETGKPVIIFSTFIQEQMRLLKLAEANGVYARVLNGSISNRESDSIDSEMRNHKLPVVIGTPACMSVGYDWNHLGSVVFVSMDFKDSNLVQGYRRGIRGDRETALAVYILSYEGSIDSLIFNKVEEKMKLSADMQEGKNVINMKGKEQELWVNA